MSILDTRPGDGELWQGDTTLPSITVSDLHHLAAVAIAEPACSRPGCDCTGPLAELHAKVDAYCARSLADSRQRAQDCEALGHVRPSWVPDRWMRRVVRCSHCSAVIA